MYILPFNLKFIDNSAKNTSNTYHTKLTFIISIINFTKLHNISRETVETAIENGELDAVGAKIVVDSPKTEDFLNKYEGKEEYSLKEISATDFSKKYNIPASKIKQLIQDGTIDVNVTTTDNEYVGFNFKLNSTISAGTGWWFSPHRQ